MWLIAVAIALARLATGAGIALSGRLEGHGIPGTTLTVVTDRWRGTVHYCSSTWCFQHYPPQPATTGRQDPMMKEPGR
jgi:hypothetical protein